MEKDVAPNATIKNFGFPNTCLASYPFWTVLLRPRQATLGSLILACKSSAGAFSEISSEAYVGLESVITDIESVLSTSFNYEKINYLMLMMIDPHVHFHVIPRYCDPRLFHGVAFLDPGWPNVPDLQYETELDELQRESLVVSLREKWPRREPMMKSGFRL